MWVASVICHVGTEKPLSVDFLISCTSADYYLRYHAEELLALLIDAVMPDKT